MPIQRVEFLRDFSCARIKNFVNCCLFEINEFSGIVLSWSPISCFIFEYLRANCVKLCDAAWSLPAFELHQLPSLHPSISSQCTSSIKFFKIYLIFLPLHFEYLLSIWKGSFLDCRTLPQPQTSVTHAASLYMRLSISVDSFVATTPCHIFYTRV